MTRDLLNKVIRRAARVGVEPPVAAPAQAVCERMFFISGHPRSGTNWVSALMNLHPLVYCAGEFHFQVLRSAMDHVTWFPWYEAHKEPVRSEIESAFADMLRRCLVAHASRPPNQPSGGTKGGKPAARVLGDHTPRLLRVLVQPPAARYIVVFRDGRDVLVSWTIHLLKTAKPEVVDESVRPQFERALGLLAVDADGRPSPEAIMAAASTLFRDSPWVCHLARVWADHTWHDLRTIESMQAAGHAEFIHRTSYEQIHRSTDAERVSLYEFLGVDPEAAAPLSKESHTLPGFDREAPRAFFRKGQVGDWRNHFTPETAHWFKETAGDRLIELGYEKGATW